MRIDLKKFLNLAGLLAAPLCFSPLTGCVISDDTGEDESAASMSMSSTSPGTDATETMTDSAPTTMTESTGVDTEGDLTGSTSEGDLTGSTSEGGGTDTDIGSTSEGGGTDTDTDTDSGGEITSSTGGA